MPVDQQVRQKKNKNSAAHEKGASHSKPQAPQNQRQVEQDALHCMEIRLLRQGKVIQTKNGGDHKSDEPRLYLVFIACHGSIILFPGKVALELFPGLGMPGVGKRFRKDLPCLGLYPVHCAEYIGYILYLSMGISSHDSKGIALR